MKVSKGKRQIVLAALVVFLGVAVFVNWYYTSPDSMIKAADGASQEDSENKGVNLGDAVYVSGEKSSEYFASARLSRDTSYDEAVATLMEIIDSSQIDEQSVRTAADSLGAMSERRVAQTNIENLVKAKTGSQCVAVISDDSAEVIVDKSVLTEEAILQIKEIVMDNTDFSGEKISIIGAK